MDRMSTCSSVGRTSGSQATESGRFQATVYDMSLANIENRYNLRSSERSGNINEGKFTVNASSHSLDSHEVDTSSFVYLIL